MRRGRGADTQMQHVFTVFTATFNRARVLHRVYDSLRAQTFRDFEWLVVDDGSTDGTGALVAAWRAEADFPIRYASTTANPTASRPRPPPGSSMVIHPDSYRHRLRGVKIGHGS